MIALFLLGYILPLILVFIFCYLDKDIKTIRDLLNWSWTYLIPLVNIYIILIILMSFIVDNVSKIKFNTDWWDNFLDKRL